MTRVLLAGFAGSMGQEVVKLVKGMPGVEITAGLAHRLTSQNPEDYGLAAGTPMYTSLDQVEAGVADVWVDFTLPSSVYQNVKFALEHGFTPIVGTTGLTDQQEAELKDLAQTQGLGGLIAPNFGMSAVLLMKFAKEAAKYFPDVEIIEMHHADKKDAPSGTALATAKMIAEVSDRTAPNSVETLPGARGGDYEGIKIHSVRLPGYVAHEQVLFGGPGEALTIRQDSFDRSSFMSGVKVALEKASELDQLYVGLENIL